MPCMGDPGFWIREWVVGVLGDSGEWRTGSGLAGAGPAVTVWGM